MSDEADPDPFVVLVIRRQSGSAEVEVEAFPHWSEPEAHHAATDLVKDGQRVWLLDPEDGHMDFHEYTREALDA